MTGTPNNLLLTLSARGPGVPARVTLSRVGDPAPLAQDVIPPGAAERAARLLEPLRAFPKATVAESALTELGRALAELALPAAIRSGLTTALDTAATAGAVRLRVAATASDFVGLPWEFLWLDNDGVSGGGGFLGLHPRLRIVREGAAGPVPASSPTAGRVRVLVAHADPRSPEYPALPHLAAETQSVRAALEAPECRRAEVQVLSGATPAVLRRTLREWAPHVLHLIGHGDVRPTGNVLVLQGEREGQAALLYADELAEWVRESPVRLVVLSACHTGAGDGGAARALSAAIPAVVAMQLPLRDAAAGPMSRALYAALLESCPVDEALYQARQAVRGMGPDWGVPLVYLAPAAGPLFAPAAASLPPTNLTYRPSGTFVGRDGMMTDLDRVLLRKRGSAALIGMSGLGKTQLAAEYAHARRADFPGGVFWVGARTTRQLTDDLTALGRRFFGTSPEWSPDDALAWVREALERGPGPTLLVVDDITAEADLRLLPTTGACRLLLTMQEGYLAPDDARSYHLTFLAGEEARTLLGAAQVWDGERAAADAIASLLGGLPLALALVGGHVPRLGLTFAEYLARLEASPFPMLTAACRRFKAATGHPGAVFDALALSWRSLTPASRRVLAAAATLGPYRISPDLLWEACTSRTRAEFEEAVADLVDGTLIGRDADGWLTVHELMRIFAGEKLSKAARIKGTGRAAAALTCRLSAALDRNTTDALGAARREAAHADAVAASCRALGRDEALVPLLLAMGRMACEAGRFVLAHAHLEEGLDRLRETGLDGPTAARFLCERSGVRFYLEDKTGALEDARAALALARRSFPPDAPALAEYYTQVGLCLRHLERFRRARPFYDRALALTEAAHGRCHPQVAQCLHNLGTMLRFQGDLDNALAFLREALAVLVAAEPQSLDVGPARNNLGELLGLLGRWPEALALHEEALALYVAAYEASYGRRHPDIARSLFYIAEAQRALGSGGEARANYEQCLTLYEQFYGPENYRCQRVRNQLADLPPL